MRDTDQEMQTNVQPSNTRAARAGTKMAPMHQYSKEHFKRICRKIKSSITPEEYEHATRHTSRNHHHDVFVKMSIPQPCKRRRSLAIYDLLSSTTNTCANAMLFPTMRTLLSTGAMTVITITTIIHTDQLLTREPPPTSRRLDQAYIICKNHIFQA